MLIFEFKTYGKPTQFVAIDEAIRASQFIRNECIRNWMENQKVSKYDLNKQCADRAHGCKYAATGSSATTRSQNIVRSTA